MLKADGRTSGTCCLARAGLGGFGGPVHVFVPSRKMWHCTGVSLDERFFLGDPAQTFPVTLGQLLKP